MFLKWKHFKINNVFKVYELLNHVWFCNLMSYSPPCFSIQWNSSGNSTGVGCHSPLQGICLTQGLPHCRHQGSPTTIMDILKYNCGFICFSMQLLVFASCIFDPLFIHIKDCYFFFEELTQLSLYNAPLYHGVKNWYYFFKYSTKFTSEAIWLLHGKI